MVTLTESSLAYDYATRVADDVRAYDYIIAGGDDDDENAPDGVAQILIEADDNGDEAVSDYIGNSLDVEIYGQYNGAGWDVTEVKLLVAGGGPNCRIVADGGDTVAVDCWWGSDHSTVLVNAPGLASRLWELADGI